MTSSRAESDAHAPERTRAAHIRRRSPRVRRWDAAPVDVSYAVVAEFDRDDVPTDQQIAVNDLLRREEVVQVAWATRAEPRPRPARPGQVLVAMVLLNHTATETAAG